MLNSSQQIHYLSAVFLPLSLFSFNRFRTIRFLFYPQRFVTEHLVVFSFSKNNNFSYYYLLVVMSLYISVFCLLVNCCVCHDAFTMCEVYEWYSTEPKLRHIYFSERSIKFTTSFTPRYECTVYTYLYSTMYCYCCSSWLLLLAQ